MGAVGMVSPSIDATVDSPGQWIAQLGASGVDGNGGGDGDGEPGDSDERAYGRGGRDDRGKEFALVNPRNINVHIFVGKSFNVNHNDRNLNICLMLETLLKTN